MRIIGWVFLLLGLVGGLVPAAGQLHAASDTLPTASSAVAEDRTVETSSRSSPAPDASLYYIAGRAAILHNLPDTDTPTGRLSMRTPVARLGCGDTRCRVRTED